MCGIPEHPRKVPGEGVHRAGSTRGGEEIRLVRDGEQADADTREISAQAIVPHYSCGIPVRAVPEANSTTPSTNSVRGRMLVARTVRFSSEERTEIPTTSPEEFTTGDPDVPGLMK